MFPGDEGERTRRDRAEKLRDHDDVFAAVFVRQMSRRQRKANDRNREHQADKPKSGGGMCPPIDLPLHRYGQHLAADDGEKISRHIKIEVGKAKGGIGIVRRQSDWPNGRRCFVLIHESAREERARQRLASGVRVAREVLNKEGRSSKMRVIPSASEGPHLNFWITQANLAIQHCRREVPRPRNHSGFGMTRATLQLKVARQFDFAGNELKKSREPFLTS